MFTIYSSKKITICSVQGDVYGGGNGLIASCDFTFALESAFFTFSEVHLGLVPATIAPYVIKKTGINHAKDLMLTGRKISAREAFTLGLIYQSSLSETELKEKTAIYVDLLRKGAPETQKAIKRMIMDVSGKNIDENLQHYTAEILTKARVSAEGVEGMNSFVEKRKPSWITDFVNEKH
ncbi:MAG: hypothetical protein HC906_02530 [Bacteroidales bacterium]|nr:hypothetical protein [Bacteroidales bacterium]